MEEDVPGGHNSVQEAAAYIADMCGQLALMAHRAGLHATSAVLQRAHGAALADLGLLQAGSAAPDDAA